MKKLLSVILVICMMLAIAGCNNSEEAAPVVNKTDIVGEWMAPAINAAAIFNADGTGELSWNGKKEAVWNYVPETDNYNVVAGATYQVTFGKEYDMPYICINGVDFFKLDDYNNAYNLMIGKRFEDINNLTAEMTKVTTDDVYTLANGVTIQFHNIEFLETEENDGVYIEYMITNESETTLTSGLTLTLNAKYYLASKQEAFTGFASEVLASSVPAGSGITDSFEFPLVSKVEETVSRDSMVIGAIFFEMNGQDYYIDLSFMGK